MNDEDLIQESIAVLAKMELGQWKQYHDLLAQKTFHDDLKAILMDETVVKPCMEAVLFR